MSVALNAQVRTRKGKSGARRIRGEGACPAVLYGLGAEPRALQIEPATFLKVMSTAGENALIDLNIVDETSQPVETRKVIVREIQYAPLKALPLHVDFYVVSMDRAISVKVPLELVGTPAAVATKTGTLAQQVHEVHVECLPSAIPARLAADVSGLVIGHSLHVSDLALPPGVTILDAPELTLATLSGIQAEVEAPVAPQLETAEPEVIRERKPAGEEG